MADKKEYKLNIGERFTLLTILPSPGNYSTYKILTKLRMTLAPDEKEVEKYKFEQQFRCGHKTYDDKGRAEQCEWETFSDEQPKCPIHDVYCDPQGFTRWAEEVALDEKSIWVGKTAEKLIRETLKKLNEEDDLKVDADFGLYKKFVLEDEDEEE